MALILLETIIKAPQQVVFDISRSVDLHRHSMTHHKEEIIAGVQTGLMNKGDTVTWRARHFWKRRKLQVKITALQPHHYFKDEMIAGDFKCMRHEHYFEEIPKGIKMTDHFYFEAPYGVIGKMVEAIVLKRYMTNLLLQRNAVIKAVAESNDWKQYI